MPVTNAALKKSYERYRTARARLDLFVQFAQFRYWDTGEPIKGRRKAKLLVIRAELDAAREDYNWLLGEM